MKLIKNSILSFFVAFVVAWRGIRYSFFGDVIGDFCDNFKYTYFALFYALYYNNGAGYYSWRIGEHGSCGSARLFKRKPKLKKWMKRPLNDLLSFPAFSTCGERVIYM